jgi:hypothetical protein
MPQPRRGFHALSKGFSPHARMAFTPSARASARTSARTRGQRTAHAPAPQGLSRPQQGLQPARAGNARRMPQPRRGFHALSKGFSPHARATHGACPSPAGAFTPSARASARTRRQRTAHAPAPQGLSRPQQGLQPARTGLSTQPSSTPRSERSAIDQRELRRRCRLAENSIAQVVERCLLSYAPLPSSPDPLKGRVLRSNARFAAFPRLLPLIPPTPFSHKGRRGSLGIRTTKTREGTQGLPEKPVSVRGTHAPERAGDPSGHGMPCLTTPLSARATPPGTACRAPPHP